MLLKDLGGYVSFIATHPILYIRCGENLLADPLVLYPHSLTTGRQ